MKDLSLLSTGFDILVVSDGKPATEQIMESENNRLADQLASKVSRLKMVSFVSLQPCLLLFWDKRGKMITNNGAFSSILIPRSEIKILNLKVFILIPVISLHHGCGDKTGGSRRWKQ